MNRINFDQLGGFPIELETFKAMQDAYNMLQVFGDLAGTKAIIKGCVQTGTNVSDGFIYWDGELLPFVGGGIQSKIVIVEQATSSEFENGEIKETYFNRYATFGTGTAAVLWSEFKRVFPLSSALMIDEVRMYAGDLYNIPFGWYLCDGQNGTRDLRGRFIVGYDPDQNDYNAIGKQGGEKEVTLTEGQMPSHTHTGSTNSAGNHTHSVPAESSIAGSSVHFAIQANNRARQQGEPAGDHTHTLNINASGNNEAHENRPPFYTLAYIQFKGI